MSQNNPLRALLDKQDILLLDGAMATELEARGCNLADSLWSAKVLVENPELIREVHLDYYRAGAQCAITASYQATPAGFAARGLDEAQSKALIGKSVELARKAREAYLAEGTVAKLAMRQPFVLFKGLTFQKLCLPGAFRPGDHHNKMLRPGLCVVHASPQYL